MSLKHALVALLASGAMSACLFACGADDGSDEGDLPQIDCTTTTVPKFAEVTIWPRCTNCHASTLTGGDRAGAPEGVDFDVYESAVEHAEHAMEEVHEGKMPIGDDATEEEKQSLYAWAQCETPE